MIQKTRSYEREDGEAIPYRELPPSLRGLKITKIWFDEVNVPIHEDEGPHEEDGVLKHDKQKALIFVMERRVTGCPSMYDALLLEGTKGVQDEIHQTSREVSDHEGLDSIYPRTKGLWVWEGTLVFHNGPEEMPQWQGEFRTMTAQDFKDLGV